MAGAGECLQPSQTTTMGLLHSRFRYVVHLQPSTNCKLSNSPNAEFRLRSWIGRPLRPSSLAVAGTIDKASIDGIVLFALARYSSAASCSSPKARSYRSTALSFADDTGFIEVWLRCDAWLMIVRRGRGRFRTCLDAARTSKPQHGHPTGGSLQTGLKVSTSRASDGPLRAPTRTISRTPSAMSPVQAAPARFAAPSAKSPVQDLPARFIASSAMQPVQVALACFIAASAMSPVQAAPAASLHPRRCHQFRCTCLLFDLR